MLIVGDTLVPKIGDFGFARDLDKGSIGSYSFAGSRDYAAPETLNFDPYGKPSDVWAIGVILHEMISGSHPFDQNVKKIKDSEAKSLPEWVDEDIRGLVKNLLSKDPKHRMNTAQIIECLVLKKISKLSVSSAGQEEEKISKPLSSPVDKRVKKLEECIESESQLTKTQEQRRFIALSLPKDKAKLRRIYSAFG